MSDPTNPTNKQRLASCTRLGFRKGGVTAWRLLRIMIPVSFCVAMLRYFGMLDHIGPYLQPVFQLLGLPAESVIACVTAASLSVYAGIAVLVTIPLTERQLTILAMMILVAHNLPVESAIQHKAGTSVWRMVLLRIAASFAAGFVLNAIMPAGSDAAEVRGSATVASEGFWPAMAGWALGMAKESAKIIAIVVGLMILQEVLKEFKLMDRLAKPLGPLLWVLGLPKRMAFLWIVANVVGLAYGSGIILEEVEAGALTRKDAQLLNRSMAVCHSLLEDTLLFYVIGAWVFWITVPRLVLAALVVWAYRGIVFFWKREKT